MHRQCMPSDTAHIALVIVLLVAKLFRYLVLNSTLLEENIMIVAMQVRTLQNTRVKQHK